MPRLYVLASLCLLVNYSSGLTTEYRSLARRCGGPSGHSCVDGMSSCRGGKCVCNRGFAWGDSEFSCYKQETVGAESRNDPVLTNFNNESLPFHFPCRYLFTHVRPELLNKRGQVIGDCEIKIYAFNAKDKGKIFTHGFDVALAIHYDDGRVIKRSSRHSGIAYRGRFVFRSNGTKRVFAPHGPWNSQPIRYNDNRNGIKVSVSLARSNNQLVYEVKQCGIRITFVPYDVLRRRSQVTRPGLSVGIDNAFYPHWLSRHRTLALPPVRDGGSLFADNRMHGLNDEESLLVRAFTKSFVHNQPYSDQGQCHAAGMALDRCSRRERSGAMAACYWMLKQPRFIRCMDGSRSGKKILEVFARCIKVWCGRERCSRVQDRITQAGCSNIRGIDELTKFMAGDLCPSHIVH